jgi:hypothetical protein
MKSPSGTKAAGLLKLKWSGPARLLEQQDRKGKDQSDRERELKRRSA